MVIFCLYAPSSSFEKHAMNNQTESNLLQILVIIRSRHLFDTLAQLVHRQVGSCELHYAPNSESIEAGFTAKPNLIIADPFLEVDDLQPDLRQRLKARPCSCPLVALIPVDTVDYRDAAIQLNANGIVAKSEIATELVPVIEQVMARAGLQNRVADRIRWRAEASSPMGEAVYEQWGEDLGARSSRAIEQLAQEMRLPDQQEDQAPYSLSRRTFIHGLKYSTASPGANQGEKVWRTACNLNCGSHFCGMQVTVRNGQAIKVEPADFPDRRYRRICLKGISQLQLAVHPERVLHPLKRLGARNEGRWQQISWDQALDEITDRMEILAAQYGPQSMMFMAGSGQLSAINGFAGTYLRLASVLGASGTSLAEFGFDSAVPSGFEMTYGSGAGYLANDYSDLPNSKVVLIWGGDPAQSLMNWWPFFLEAKRQGTHLVAIDPKFTLTASKCNEWAALRPGSDIYLALGLVHLIFQEGWLDESFIREHTVGPFLVREDTGEFLRSRSGEYQVYDPALRGITGVSRPGNPMLQGSYPASGTVCRPALALLEEMSAAYPLDFVAEKTGLSREQIYHLAELMVKAKPARIFCHYGVDRWHHGATFGRLIATLAAITGNVGIPGAGAGIGGSPEGIFLQSSFTTPGGKSYRAINPAYLAEAISQGNPYPIRGVWTGFSNWLNQWPDHRHLCEEVIPGLDLFVVTDLFMTETARWADYVLPAAHLFEREDLVSGPGPFVQYQPAILSPKGESRSDYEIAGEIARRLGHGDTFSQTPGEQIAQILAEDPRTHQMTFAQLKQEGVLRRESPAPPTVAHSRYEFQTPSGRIEFYSERGLAANKALPVFEAPVEAKLDGELAGRYPLVCISKTSRYRVHSTFVNATWLREIEPEPFIMINPEDAARRGILDNGWARVFNDRGYVVLRARIRTSVPPGAIYLPAGWQSTDFVKGHSQDLTHRYGNADNLLGPNNSYSDVRVEVENAEAGGFLTVDSQHEVSNE